MIDSRDITVVGAGIGGLTTALCLARAGATVTVLERAAQARPVGAGILLMNNGLSVLTGLGLGERLRSGGHCVRLATLHSAGGAVLSAIPVQDYGPGLDHALMLRRSVLHSALLEAVEAEPRATVVFGASVWSATPAGEVCFDGPGGVAELTSDLVVAADGVRSALRGCGDFCGRVRDLEALSIRGMVPIETPALATLQEYWSSVGVFGGAPMGDGSTYFFASGTKRPLPQLVALGDLAGFRRAWRKALPCIGPVLDAVGEFDELHVTNILRVDTRRWVDGRLVLLGDAAHAMPPNLGQGGSSAILDAALLAAELAAEPNQARALRRYEQRRRPTVTAAQDRACRLFDLTEVPRPTVNGLRNLGVRLAAKLPSGGSDTGLMQENPRSLFEETVGLAG